MPQIWMTYDELGSLLDSSADDARAYILSLPLDRKKSRDGRTRVKLNAALSALFCARIREADVEFDAAIAQLRLIHAQMAGWHEAKILATG